MATNPLPKAAFEVLGANFSDVILTPTSLQLPKGFSLPRWEAIGVWLGRSQRSIAWWIGDWWNFGHAYGSRKQTVEEWGGLAFQTCENYGAVARHFETSRRREVLSFTHHNEVAYIEATKADELLQHAEQYKWSSRDLRRKVEEYKRERDLIDARRIYRGPVANGEQTVQIRVEEDDRGGRTTTIHYPSPQRTEPAIALDDSAPILPVPSELKALTVEPPPPINRIAIAQAALDSLTFPELLAVFRATIVKLSPTELHKLLHCFPDCQ